MPYGEPGRLVARADARESSEPGDQFVDLPFVGGPTGDEAHDGLLLAARPPHLEGCILAQPVDFLVRKYEELLVGRRIDPEAVAPGPERLFQFPGRRDGLARDPQVEVVRKEGFELNAQQPSLGQQGSVLLDEGEDCLLYTSPSPRDRG